MRKCLNGHLVDEKSKYCSQCGAEVIDYLNYCAHCGHKRSGDEKYCIKCGASLGNTSNSCDVQDLMLANKKKISKNKEIHESSPSFLPFEPQTKFFQTLIFIS